MSLTAGRTPQRKVFGEADKRHIPHPTPFVVTGAWELSSAPNPLCGDRCEGGKFHRFLRQKQKPPRPRSHLPPPESAAPPFPCSPSRSLLSCLRALFCASGSPLGHVDGLHPTCPQQRHFHEGVSSAPLAPRPRPRPPPRARPRAPPRGGKPAAGACLSGGGLSGGLSGGFPPAVSNLRSLVFNSAISLTVLPLVGFPLGGTSCRPRL